MQDSIELLNSSPGGHHDSKHLLPSPLACMCVGHFTEVITISVFDAAVDGAPRGLITTLSDTVDTRTLNVPLEGTAQAAWCILVL